jgi:hypothetical protein
MKYFILACLSLCACSAAIDPNSPAPIDEQNMVQDTTTDLLGLPDGCRVEYFANDPNHEHPVALCGWYNARATNTPDPAPEKIQERLEMNKLK